jgi:hypothetical protein
MCLKSIQVLKKIFPYMNTSEELTIGNTHKLDLAYFMFRQNVSEY